MALIEFNNFSFKYNESEDNILSDINLEVESGDFVLICGPSGCGKTTLLSNLKKELLPNGIRSGEVKYDNCSVGDLDDLVSACDIGYLFQNPDAQIVTDSVIQEIAFPLENIGTPTEEIRNRISELVSFFGINEILHKNVDELSNGQKQLVNLCSLLVLRPKVLILDEPLSQLDPITSYKILSIIRRLNEEFSITIIMSEHQLDNIFPLCDKVVFLNNGQIEFNDNPRDVCKNMKDDMVYGHFLPSVCKIYKLLVDNNPSLANLDIPLNIREARRFLNKVPSDIITSSCNLEFSYDSSNETLIKMKNVYFAYEKHNLIIKNLNFDLRKGDYAAIVGSNGCGKSTLLQILTGLIDPIKGKVKSKKDLSVAYVHQNPMIHFSHDTVKEELVEDNENNSNFKNLVEFFQIEDLLNQHPYDCSGGEQQKIVIVKALLKNPDVLVLDEPTKCLDPISSKIISDKLKTLHNEGLTIIMVSHDLDFVANNFNRCLMLFDKTIQVDNHPKNIFVENNFYTTFVNRMVKDHLNCAVTIGDVAQIWNLK